MNINLVKFSLFFLLMPSFIFSQDLDSSFLESLPSEVRSELINQNSLREEQEDPQYRRPSTFVMKPELSTSGRFGTKIFSMMQSTLMPLNEPNFDGNYILDFGDVLELQLVGQKSSVTKIHIKRDGSVNVPDIGKVFLSGLSLEQASELIKNKIEISFIGVEAFLTLINVRDIQIIVAGNVFNPGPYTLNGNSNIFHALSVSGGPADTGSYRNIELIRDNKSIETIDLYDTFILGKSSFKTRLRSGDIVFVQPVQNMVKISGGVKRSGLYELTSTENLDKVLFFANGVSNLADLNDIQIFRVLDGKIKSIRLTNISQLNNILSNDNDSLTIKKFSYRNVSISGAVINPGSYLVNEGEGLLELVKRAGGYSLNAYPYGGVLENQIARNINQMAVDKLHRFFLNSVSNSSSVSSSETNSSFFLSMLDELKNSPVSGRVSAEFDLSILEEDPSLNTILQDGDNIVIPELVNQVYIFGEISSEGTTRFEYGKDLQYYINKKGGYTDYADKKGIFILHPNGDTIRLGSKNRFISNKVNVEFLPGSVIFIPKKLSTRAFATQTAQAYAAILGNIGVSLASVSILKD